MEKQPKPDELVLPDDFDITQNDEDVLLSLSEDDPVLGEVEDSDYIDDPEIPVV